MSTSEVQPAGAARPGQEDHEARGLLLAATAFVAWGLLSPGNEILLRQYTPMWMQAIRAGLAALVLLVWAGPSGLVRAWRVLRDGNVMRALFFGTFASFALFAASQTRVEATFTTLGFYTSPLWTALIARALLGERVGWGFIPAAAGLLTGGYLALTGAGTLPAPDMLGIALATASGLTWGLYAVFLRRDTRAVPWQDLLLAGMVLATPLFILTAVLFEPLPDVSAFTKQTWMWTFIQVAIPTLVSLGLYQTSLRYAPAGHINILVGLELASTVLFAWLLLDARFTAIQMAGLALVLASVSLYLWHRTRPRGIPRGPV